MKSSTLFLVVLLFSAGLLTAQDTLSARGRQVLEYLLEDWKQHMHSTSIALAIENVGLPPDDGLRLEVGNYLRRHRDIANNIKWWGANNYILSNQEKRIAKYLIFQLEKRSGRVPSLEDASRELQIPPRQLARRLQFMSRAGLLEAGDTALGYKLISHYARWGGPLRFNYHTITIGQGKPFDVW